LTLAAAAWEDAYGKGSREGAFPIRANCWREGSMRERFARLFGLACVSALMSIGLELGLSAPASATAVYTYTGNDFTSVTSPYTTSMSVTASMTLTNPIGPNQTNVDETSNLVAISLADGVHSLSLTTPNIEVTTATFTTDSAGNITSWNVLLGVFVGVSPPVISTENDQTLVQDTGAFLNGPSGAVANDPGVWTLVSVPEPSSVVLLALGLVAMAGSRRRNV